VFTPNFTTKSSGTGLGLAISANMIESCNGRIYFETEEGKGTDFYMAIPLMRLDDYLSDDQFVSLD
jgi:signal transduction histidine kinase